jgi:hypothetical protein
MPLKLAGLLVTSGAAPATLVEDALRRQVLSGCAMDTALLEAGTALTEAHLLRELQRASGLSGVDAAALAAADQSLASLLPAKLAQRHCLLPLRAQGRTLTVAVPYPPRGSMLVEIGFLLGRPLQPVVALELRLREAIGRVYGCPVPARHQTLLQRLGPAPQPQPNAPAAPGEPWPPDARPWAERPADVPSPVQVAETEPSREGLSAARSPAASRALTQDAFPPAASGGGAPLIVGPRKMPPLRGPREIALMRDSDGLVRAIEQALEAAQRGPHLLPNASHSLLEPHNRVDAAGPAKGIVAVSKGVPAAEAEPPDSWTLAEASAAVDQALDRHQVIRVALRFALKSFDFAAAFTVVGGNAVGWAAQTREGPADERVARISLPLDAPSVLRTVLLAKGRYVGPLPTDALSQSLAKDLERPQPTAVFLYPIEVRDRPVALLYGDVVGRALGDRCVGELVVFAQSLGRRIERLIVEQKRRLASERSATSRKEAPSAGGQSGAASGGAPSASELSLEPNRPAEGRSSSGPLVRGLEPDRPAEGRSSSGPLVRGLEPNRPAEGRSSSGPLVRGLEPALTPAELFARSPPRHRAGATSARDGQDDAVEGALEIADPATAAALAPASRGATGVSFAVPASMDDLFAAADRLVGTDSSERARALAELARYPEISAAVLIARFPGPLLRARVPVSELPSPDELGPVPGALARMGPAAARALAPLLEHRDADSRYYALLTAGKLPSPVLVAPVAQGVFDRHPVVASAARVALAAMRAVPGFDEALAKIRAGLSSRDSETAISAAKAVGLLRDVESVENLIGLTGLENEALAQAAADALRAITLQSLGLDAQRWASWWEQAKHRPRAEWLAEALRHRDKDLRASAIEELARVAGDDFGYLADGPRHEREAALRRWEEWQRAGDRPPAGQQ